jgi:hypothetical protein
MPNEIKLEGVKKYLAWSRSALRLLKAKRLEGYVKGDVVEPKDKLSAVWKDWDAINSLVAAWMLSSMIPAIASTVDTIISAAEMWKALEEMYSGAGNVMLMVETEDRLHNIKQGERSVVEYVHELQCLWADADHYDPIELPHSKVCCLGEEMGGKKTCTSIPKGAKLRVRGKTCLHVSSIHSS